ncbi:chemotaxis protein [Photobacterium gaetbulicola]|uniref:Uncharacterized protein n=1 Tax=Photobacterium gaetbulicola Gung47 TaxID=658445 RepID=A0A0C5WUB8_9GAMM|nr:hypothetical protein [Photobacterium gaetbulicola]AJR08669.1 hypothetical protein H744_2c2005 [Photobacterium gaetbulicola Gung47]PSU10296.1 chemotaxis protein [Photobacterium gaetbulicola]
MGRSKSSKSSNTTNVSGTAAASGDNNGVMLSGVNDSSISVNMTDHGAMQIASELGELAIASNVEVTTGALESNTEVSKAALNMGAHSLSEALDFGRDSLEGALMFGNEAMHLNAEVSNNAIDTVSQSHHENLQMIAGLAGSQAAQNTENLAALKGLAEMNADGGQVATSRQMTIVVGLVMAFMAVMMVGGKR